MTKEYMEREAAKARLRLWITNCVLAGDNDEADCFRGCIDLLDSIPAADVAPVRRGNWEEWWPGIAEIMAGKEMLYRCSACDAKYADIDGYKYCPYCGAKMNKEEA